MHTEETRAKFRAEYLCTGNAKRSAETVGIAVSTGVTWAAGLRREPEFMADVKEMQDGFLSELVTMRQDNARLAHDRSQRDDEQSTDYMRIVNEAERNAQNLAKLQPREATTPNVTITVTGPAEVESDEE